MNKRRVLLIIIVFLGILAILPAHYLETNIKHYKDEETRKFAEFFIELTGFILENPLEHFFILSYGIQSIEVTTGRNKSSNVVAYTFFGIPYAEVVVDSDGAYVKKRFYIDQTK